jgi:6-phospho-beta-glucosidase
VPFPPGFVWGAATAALQIEGADGRGPSVWDDFCAAHPERIHRGATPAVACDHYRRWREDVEWMGRLGHNGYRFSISWPRVDPEGNGGWNAAGLDFYDRLVDALLARGVAPNVTLYHWDLPSPLGSWDRPDTVERFLRYAEVCFDRLGDRVKLWATLNEPGWTTLNGYVTALHPPCLHDPAAALRVAHNLLTAHARATEMYHAKNLDGGVGIALNLSAVRPAGPHDGAAAALADGILNRWFIEPVLLNAYPADIVERYERCGLAVARTRFPGRVDWLGVNYYYPHHASADAPRDEFHLNTSGNPADPCLFAIEGLFRMVRNPPGRYTEWGWEIDPSGLRDLLLRAKTWRSDIPVYVTENGIGLQEAADDGGIDDSARIEFVREHLTAVEEAIAAGVDVRGYYMWSLLDNFSWINGFKKRYGFLFVDRETLERTPKKSAWWFREVALRGGL